jgi:magnesium transporter
MAVVIIASAVYRNGAREDFDALRADLEVLMESLSGTDFVWIGINNPTDAEMQRIGDALNLHPLAIEDALESHQRPKVEKYDDHTFISLRTVWYSLDSIETHEVNLFVGAHYLLTVRHGGPSLHLARKRLDSHDGAHHGTIAATHTVIDTIVDGYESAAAQLEEAVEEVEGHVFDGSYVADSSRIYRLKRETLEFRRAVAPLREPINRFAMMWAPEGSRPYFRDVVDHLQRAFDTIDTIDHLLDNALSAHLAQLSVQQNEDMRKLTAGATIFAVPTAVAGIYGMNFHYMPELSWHFGYPLMLGLTGALCFYIYRRFKKAGWL